MKGKERKRKKKRRKEKKKSPCSIIGTATLFVSVICISINSCINKSVSGHQLLNHAEPLIIKIL